MEYLDIMTRSIETSEYILRKVELMKWVEEDLHDTLKDVLLGAEFEPGIQVHAQVSFGAVFKHGPHYDTVKHIRPDFLLVDKGRYPIAFIDYLSEVHDPAQDDLKKAIAKKADIAFIQIPAKSKPSAIRALLREAGVADKIQPASARAA
ncbi:MAG: DUF2726 domain-containing protein [Hyphomicrobiales bacterium]|nr:DUF2726 domain-containing protein [Hyphomicrobiales bacterium]MDE2113701.1 DUF2726 domain-containing protein [Hyphomicrobiales bacterium]